MKYVLTLLISFLLSVSNAVSCDCATTNICPCTTCQCAIAAENVKNWSDPATWGGTLPTATTDVVILAGDRIILDMPNVVVKSIMVHGELVVQRMDVALTAGFIQVMDHGKFIAGTVEEPFTNSLIITINEQQRETPTFKPHNMGARFFGAMNDGLIQIIGTDKINWVMLDANANAGADTILLDSIVPWESGDKIIVTSTDFDAYQTEEKTIQNVIDGATKSTLTLTTPLSHYHHGSITTYNHGVAGVPTTIDERAEVGLLSSNIVVQGAADADEAGPFQGYGGHMMMMDSSSARIRGVELRRMGQQGLLGRYPIHWHGVDNAGATLVDVNNPALGYIRGSSTSYFHNSSSHHSFNRGMTIHRTNYISVADNVIYDTIGHAYFLEDGREIGNVFTHNLGALAKRGTIIPSDAHPSVFWTPNPNNDYYYNAAAGAEYEGYGFKFDLPYRIPTNTISNLVTDPDYSPQAQPYGKFWYNRAHSIAGYGSNQPVEFAFGLWAREGLPAYDAFYDFTTFKLGSGGTWFVSYAALAARGYVGNTPFYTLRHVGDQVLRNPAEGIDSLVLGRTNNPVSSSATLPTPEERYWLDNYDEQNAGVALSGYDFNASAQHSVFVGYRNGIVPIRGGWTGETLRGCVQIDCNMIRNPAGLTLIPYFMPDFDDIFHNGHEGAFSNDLFLKDSSSKNGDAVLGVGNGAKGIAPDDTNVFWSPYGVEKIGAITFATNHVASVFIRRNDIYAQQYQLYTNPQGTTHDQVAMLADYQNWLEFVGLPNGGDTSDIAWFFLKLRRAGIGDYEYANHGHYVAVGLLAPNKSFTLQGTQVFTPEAYRDATSTVWFLDQRYGYISVKGFETLFYYFSDVPAHTDIANVEAQIDAYFQNGLAQFNTGANFGQNVAARNIFINGLHTIWNPADFTLANRTVLQDYYTASAMSFATTLYHDYQVLMHSFTQAQRVQYFGTSGMMNAIQNGISFSMTEAKMVELSNAKAAIYQSIWNP